MRLAAAPLPKLCTQHRAFLCANLATPGESQESYGRPWLYTKNALIPCKECAIEYGTARRTYGLIIEFTNPRLLHLNIDVPHRGTRCWAARHVQVPRL